MNVSNSSGHIAHKNTPVEEEKFYSDGEQESSVKSDESDEIDEIKHAESPGEESSGVNEVDET